MHCEVFPNHLTIELPNHCTSATSSLFPPRSFFAPPGLANVHISFPRLAPWASDAAPQLFRALSRSSKSFVLIPHSWPRVIDMRPVAGGLHRWQGIPPPPPPYVFSPIRSEKVGLGLFGAWRRFAQACQPSWRRFACHHLEGWRPIQFSANIHAPFALLDSFGAEAFNAFTAALHDCQALQSHHRAAF